MKRAVTLVLLSTCLAPIHFGQTAEPQPRFEAADVRVAAKMQNALPRTGPVRGGRYEVKNASMVDLIRFAWGFDTDKVLGGPNWLEMDRFDVVAKVPSGSTPETQKLMLQALIEERSRPPAQKEPKRLPSYVLIAGKKPLLKEATGQEDAGCKPVSGGVPASGEPGGIRIMMAAGAGAPTTIALGPGMTIQYNCRNMTMEAFVANLRTMMGTSLGTSVVRDGTGLKGAWNFDLQ